MTETDRAWLDGTLNTWRLVRDESLGMTSAPLPRILLFDVQCVWHASADMSAPQGYAVRGEAHGGVIRTPDGHELPPVLTSFTASYDTDRKPFVVMAMPAIWRNEPRVRVDPNIEPLIRSVFVHEMTHALQVSVMAPLLDRLSQRLERPDELNDDIIQTVFGRDAGFRAAYERERDLFYQASRERDPARRALHAADALRVMEARRGRYFTGSNAFYRELEDAFLVMEGVANWAAYTTARADGLAEADALTLIRRGGRNWSQDEGLALLLLLEAQGTRWRDRVFGVIPPSVPALLRPEA